MSHRFWAIVCSFSFVSRIFLIYSFKPLLSHSLFNNMKFSLHEFECFWVFFPWDWFLVLSHCNQRKCLIQFQFSWICWGLFCVLPCGLPLKMFYVHLKRMYILLLCGERFYIYQLSGFHLECRSITQYPCWFFVWRICPWFTVRC